MPYAPLVCWSNTQVLSPLEIRPQVYKDDYFPTVRNVNGAVLATSKLV